MIAVQKRSGKRHLVNRDTNTTVCGRTLYRHNWKVRRGRETDCEQCWRVVAAQLGLRPLMPSRWERS